MSPRLPKGVLASSHAHLCLPCRLRHVPPCKCFNPRYQHGEAFQLQKDTPKASLVSLQPNHGDGSRDSAENAAGPQAANLQQLLQKQFAERRRQNMEKLGLRQTTQARAETSEGSGESQATDLPGKEKAVKLSRRRRSQRPKSSVSASTFRKATSQNAAIPKSKNPEKATSGIPSHQQVIATEKQGSPSTNPLLKLHANVQKIKKALETKDKKKRASQIRLSALKLPKGQAENVSRRALSKSDTPERSPARLASRGVGGVKDRLSGTALTENVLVNKAKISQCETMTPTKSDQGPVRLPYRTGSGQNAVIEMINAKALEISGNVPCVLALIQDLIITAVEVDQPPVPSLSFGLERVLFKLVSFPSLAK